MQDHGFAYIEKIIDSDEQDERHRRELHRHNSRSRTIPVKLRRTFPPASTRRFHQGILLPPNATEHQNEGSHFGIVSYLRSEEDLDFQVRCSANTAPCTSHPDILGDIAFNGIAQDAMRQRFANGVQAEASYKLGAAHTFRGGVLAQRASALSRCDTSNSPSCRSTGPVHRSPIRRSPSARQSRQDRMDIQRLSAGRMAGARRPSPSISADASTLVNTVHHGKPDQPAVQRGLAGDASTTVHAGYANYFTPPPFELVIDRERQACSAPTRTAAFAFAAEFVREGRARRTISMPASRKKFFPASKSASTSITNTRET